MPSAQHQVDGSDSRASCSINSSIELGSRRRTAGARAAGCGIRMLVILVMMMLASTDAFSFKAWGKGGLFALSKRGTGGREKVKEDVAWLLEDPSDGGWMPVKDDGHVKVWKRFIPGSDFVAIKSSATLAVSPQALYEILAPGDIEIVRQYNPMIEHSGDLEVMDRDNKVTWSATMGIWPCRARDFVTHIRRATLADGSVAIINFATTHPKAPNKGRFVRGEILRGVFHIKAAKNKKHSEFTMVHHFNPGGGVPAWLINRLAEGKPLAFVQRLEKVAAKWDGQAKTTKGVPYDGGGFGEASTFGRWGCFFSQKTFQKSKGLVR